MSARGKGYVQDWDPMRDDYDNSAYDQQYPDDNSSGYVNLDHCRLYITNIPKGLSDEGISVAFSKFGQLTESFVSKDPDRRYGLVGFETPGEAKLAMMKLNRTEPLRLNVSLAHKKKPRNDNRDRVSSEQRDRGSRSFRDDTGSVGSRSNRRQDLANGDMDNLVEEDVGLNNSLDPDTNLELEHLRLEHLKLQEAQVLCKHRMLLLKQAEKKASATSRCILPDGRIIVRSVDKAETVRENDNSFGAGAGDSRFGKCVVCGERADAFCAACGVTPYCSGGCQRRDWADRHRKVCHNLKRASGADGDGAKARMEPDPESALKAAAPLRRPRSPESRRDDDTPEDKLPPRKFGPPGGAISSAPSKGGFRNARGGGNRNEERTEKKPQNRSSDYQEGYNRKQEDRAPNRSRDGQSDNRSRDGQGDNRPSRDRNDRFRQNRDAPAPAGGPRGDGRKQNQDEDWGGKSDPKPEEQPKPSFQPKTPPHLLEPKLLPRAVPAAKPAAEVKEPVVTAAPTAPARVLVPKNCLIDLLKENDTITLSVDASAADCRAGAGYVCVSLHPDYSEQYMQLLGDDFTSRCEASEPCDRKPGVTFAYLNPEDAGWYRARFLTPALAALLDASKLVSVTAADKCKLLPPPYCDLPEFSCQLQGANVKISDNVTCTILAKSKNSVSVSLVNNTTAAPMGNGTVKRWEPEVDYPAPEPVAKPTSTTVPASNAAPASTAAPPTTTAPASTAAASASVYIPEVPRPPLINNSKVVLIDATEPSRLFVRDAGKQKEYDEIITEVAVYGTSASPLKKPPVQGQTVVGKFTDGVHYRALCLRVNSKANKYQLEYIEYGNIEVQFLEDLYPCPPELDLAARPTLASRAALPISHPFTADAQQYLEQLKTGVELTLTLLSGEKSGPSGSPVRLVAGGEDAGRAVAARCAPAWLQLLERGGDVLEVPPLFFNDIEFVELPPGCCELEIVDLSLLAGNILNGFVRGAPHAAKAFALADELAAYCNSALCKEPYLPRAEELCLVFCPTKQQWLRAVMAQQNGPGGDELEVLLLDYGHILRVGAAALRKMLPEFVRGRPAATVTLEIRDFPKEPQEEQIKRARSHMCETPDGRGVLRVTRAERQELADYVVDAPDLLRAMGL